MPVAGVSARFPVSFLRQRPFFNEVVFCHKPSRTLIVSDLWCNSMSKPMPVWPASAARAADWPRLAVAWGSLRVVWRRKKPSESQLADVCAALFPT